MSLKHLKKSTLETVTMIQTIITSIIFYVVNHWIGVLSVYHFCIAPGHTVNALKFIFHFLVGFQGWNLQNACQTSKQGIP